jgi:hypothetical protein
MTWKHKTSFMKADLRAESLKRDLQNKSQMWHPFDRNAGNPEREFCV